MATKTLTITEDAYERLANLKEESESFSEVVKRLTAGHSLLDLVGVLNKEESNELKNTIALTRKKWRKTINKTSSLLQ